MISKVRFARFKQFRSSDISLGPTGVTLVAGGNNAGKSSLLQGLAVWQFCRTAIEMEQGQGALLSNAHRQGFGLGDDEFSPIAIPSLKHLWTNLKTQREAEDQDGYTLRIRCDWTASNGGDTHLEFGLALANDRLFIKMIDTNRTASDRIPVAAYLPPFAGISGREEIVSGAIRRRRIGEGLAGAVLRNILLEMFNANAARRVALRADKSKISDADLRALRATDPWELLQDTLRRRFSAELIVRPFREEYHSYIKIEVDKGAVKGYNLKRHAGYNPRDIMVEGSGFLQWLSVYALAVSPEVDVLLLDEPDAHLHPALQAQLVESIGELAHASNKQVLVATHSSELLKDSDASRILQVRAGGSASYLTQDDQKIALLAGLGSEYAPKIHRLSITHKMLMLEGTSDVTVLSAVARTLGITFPGDWVIWQTSAGHKERAQLVRGLRAEIPGLRAISLRDRDDEPTSTTDEDLNDKSVPSRDSFTTLKWRRRQIENYLLVPDAIARVLGIPVAQVEQALADDFALAMPAQHQASDCPAALCDAHGKDVLAEHSSALLGGSGKSVADVARALTAVEIADDLKKFFSRLNEAAE